MTSSGEVIALSKSEWAWSVKNFWSVNGLQGDLKRLLYSNNGDVNIIVNGNKLPAHKSILRSRCLGFEELFCKDEGKKEFVFDTEPGAMRILLEYIYTGTARDLSSNNVFEVYIAANKLKMTDFKVKIIAFIEYQLLGQEYICEVLLFAYSNNETDLLQKSFLYFVNHLDNILKSENWEKLLVTENAPIITYLMAKMGRLVKV